LEIVTTAVTCSVKLGLVKAKRKRILHRAGGKDDLRGNSSQPREKDGSSGNPAKGGWLSFASMLAPIKLLTLAARRMVPREKRKRGKKRGGKACCTGEESSTEEKGAKN